LKPKKITYNFCDLKIWYACLLCIKLEGTWNCSLILRAQSLSTNLIIPWVIDLFGVNQMSLVTYHPKLHFLWRHSNLIQSLISLSEVLNFLTHHFLSKFCLANFFQGHFHILMPILLTKSLILRWVVTEISNIFLTLFSSFSSLLFYDN